MLGTWKASLENKLTLINPKTMKNYTADKVYRIVTVEHKPFIYADPTAPKGFKGYCIDLIDEIAKLLNFDYEIREATDKKFGNMDEYGAHIGLSSMSVMAERETVIDFTVPYYDLVGITILIKLPKTPIKTKNKSEIRARLQIINYRSENIVPD